MRGSNQQESSTPYCRCRVLYLGSAVPHASKEGLLGVQEPLRELYPEQGALGARGIDSWLSVWSNGLLLENVDEHRKKVTRFFPIESLHYCAAVRHVKAGSGNDANATRFFPLDSPFARTPSANHPPLFAAVLRRTTGIKVLECHAFICKRDMAANALVRCCFHAYADSRFAKGLGEPASGASAANGGSASPTGNHHLHSPSNGSGNHNNNNNNNNNNHHHQSSGSLYHTLGGSSTTLAENGNGGGNSPGLKIETASNDDGSSLYNGDENHKVWARGRDDIDGLYQEQGTLRSAKGSRPRQLIAPPPPPPPPPPSQSLMGEEPANTSSALRKKASKKLQKKLKKQDADQMYYVQQHHQQQQLQMQQANAVYANGHGHHTLAHHPIRQQPGHGYPPHPQMPPSSRSIAGTLARPAPVLLLPAATLPRKVHHHHHHQQQHHHGHLGHPARGIRPIPAAAPIVPVYAPLPVVPPHHPGSMLYQAGYGTTGNRGRRSHHQQQQQFQSPDGIDSASLGMQSRRMAASHADLSASPPGQHLEPRSSDDSPENESRFGTGIYRRKGHLNERAFSYSIRAEHRSRSHGSLASLGFAGQPNGGPPPVAPKEEKKDREIAQMVAGLNLDDGLNLVDGRGHMMKNGGYHYHHQQQQQPLQPLPRPKAR